MKKNTVIADVINMTQTTDTPTPADESLEVEAASVEWQQPQAGFSYWVGEEQLLAFSQLSLLQRLQWLDEARRFTLLAETPLSAQRRKHLRQGTPHPQSE